MTGRSKWFDAGVYFVVAVAVLVLGAMVTPLLGIVAGLVFLVLALRAAWSDAPREQAPR